MTLTEFLLARLDEDEAEARRLPQGAWGVQVLDMGRPAGSEDEFVVIAPPPPPGTRRDDQGEPDDDVHLVTSEDEHLASHVARWGPDRVLAEVEAKRQIAKRHVPAGRDPGFSVCAACPSAGRGSQAYPCLNVRWLAELYSDHSDYDEAWRPGAPPLWPGVSRHA